MAENWGLAEGAASELTSSPTFPARLMEHEDDPDVDEPLETPLGHILGREPTSSEQGGLEGPD